MTSHLKHGQALLSPFLWRALLLVFWHFSTKHITTFKARRLLQTNFNSNIALRGNSEYEEKSVVWWWWARTQRVTGGARSWGGWADDGRCAPLSASQTTSPSPPPPPLQMFTWPHNAYPRPHLPEKTIKTRQTVSGLKPFFVVLHPHCPCVFIIQS